MKTLQILRHAKTERINPGQQDFDRRLTERGLGQMADLLQNRKDYLQQAERVLVSSARRTRMTLEQLKDLVKPEAVQWYDELYLASLVKIAGVVALQDDAVDNLLLIGHNDGLSDFVSYLLDDYVSLPTSGYVVLEMEIDSWKHISKGIGSLKTEFFSQYR